MNLAIIPNLIIFGGAFFAFILAVAQLALRDRKTNNVYLALLYFCFGFFQVTNSFTLFHATDAWYEFYQIIFPVGFMFFFFIGPLLFIYFRAVIWPERKRPPLFFLHFLPGIIALAIMIILHPGTIDTTVAPEDYLRYLRQNNPVYVIVSFLSVVSLYAYLVVLFREVAFLYTGRGNTGRNLKRITVMLIIALFPAFLYYYAYFTGSVGSRPVVTQLFMTFYLVLLYLLSIRYPQFGHIIKLAVERDKYLRSQVRNIDADAVIHGLERLMKEEGLYRSEEISLKETAARLAITSHQLSEILNNRLGKNFFELINEFRISEAKERLLAVPPEPVISICFEVGFNSPSSFYSAFKKLTGMSPSVFRKRQGQ